MGHNFINKLILVLMVLAAIAIFIYIGFKLFLIWIPFIFAWWISNLLSPLVERICKKTRLNKSLMTFVALILFVGLMLLIISTIGLVIVSQARNLLDRFPEVKDVIDKGVLALSQNVVKFTDIIPTYLTQNLDLDIPALLENINLSITTILASLVGIAAFIPNLLISIIVMFVASFFMTKDKVKLKDIEMTIWSFKIFRNKLMLIIKEDVIMVLFGYFKAQLILMSLTFIEVSIGLLILKIPYAILIALGIGLLDALPIFGTGSVFIPWVIILLFYRNYSLAIGIFILYLVATLSRQSLEPKIISTQIGIHPLITLLVIYTGIKFFGIWGIIIAPLSAITFLAVKKSGLLKIE